MKQNWFYENINKIDKLLAKQTKRNKEKTLTNKIRDKKGLYAQWNSEDHQEIFEN
jgi:hypothetical protein